MNKPVMHLLSGWQVCCQGNSPTEGRSACTSCQPLSQPQATWGGGACPVHSLFITRSEWGGGITGWLPSRLPAGVTSPNVSAAAGWLHPSHAPGSAWAGWCRHQDILYRGCGRVLELCASREGCHYWEELLRRQVSKSGVPHSLSVWPIFSSVPGRLWLLGDYVGGELTEVERQVLFLPKNP